MIINLSDTDERGNHLSEAVVIRNALRGHAREYARRAQAHNDRGYTMAGFSYFQESQIILRVLREQFNDDPPSVAG